MTANKKKLLLPKTMARAGWAIATARDDIEAVSYLPQQVTTAEFHALLADVDGVALALTPYGRAELAASPKIRVVARIGVGYDTVDIPALNTRRIPLMVVGTANSPTVAEHAMFLMLALAKQSMFQDRIVREGRWQERWSALPVDLLEKTLLIVGFGRIGTRVAKRCLALDMKVVVYDPYVSADAVRAAGCEPVSDLDAALSHADFVTIHCPKTPETTGMFDAARLARMKPSAFLVNTARGGIIDEVALHAALTGGKLGGAGIDVFEKEPVDPASPLLKLPNIIVGPHVAGVTMESMDRMAAAAVRNILSVLDGAPDRDNCVNKEVLS